MEFDENPREIGDKNPTFGELTDFLNGNAGEDGWEWLITKADDLRIRVKNDAAVVALRLRYNIEDHDDRAEATA